MRIILASQSPRRKQLLEWAEIDFDVLVSDADESFDAALPAENVAVQIARQKAKAIQQKTGDDSRVILAADTIVVLDGKIIGKPASEQEAIETLQALSGQHHKVITGVVILKGQTEISFADITDVHFHELTQEQIIFYVEKYKPFDKAGAYAIQEWIGVVGIRSISGDFYNVMGLPVSRVVKALEHLA